MAGDGTRWLDTEEQAIWRSWLLSTRLLWEALERDLQRQAGMPFQYYEVLVRLSEAPGHTLRMSELADRSQSSRSRLSHAMARLEEAGWVERRSCPSDRRGSLAVLTPAGLGALEAAAPGHVESVRTRLLDGLSREELAALGEISTRLVHHLAAQGLVCPDLASGCVAPPAPAGSGAEAPAGAGGGAPVGGGAE